MTMTSTEAYAERWAPDASMSQRLAHQESRFGELLVSKALLSRHELDMAIEHVEPQRVQLADAVVALGLVSEDDAYLALATATGLALVDLRDRMPCTRVLRLVPERVARRHVLLPLEEHDRVLTYAVSRPNDCEAERDVAFASSRKLHAVLARRSDLLSALDRCYPKGAGLELLLGLDQSHASIEVVDCGNYVGEYGLAPYRSLQSHYYQSGRGGCERRPRPPMPRRR